MIDFKVSIIIPNYNRASLIGDTLENMLTQTLEPYELIVVDDGSTDHSVEVIKSFGDDVILIKQSNRGPGAARNRGLSVATGDFIQFMDSDDLFSKNKLEVQATELERTKSDLVFSPWVKLRFEGKLAIKENLVLQQKMPSDKLPLLNWFLRSWSTVFQTFMIRHEFLKKIGGYREDLMPHEDSELFVRLMLLNPKITFTDQCITLYRLHQYAKISGDGTKKKDWIMDKANYLKCVIRDLEETHYHLDPVTRLHFKSMIWKSVKELREFPDIPAETIQPLNNKIHAMDIPALELLNYYLRGVVFWRKRFLGSPWRQYYKPGNITDQQIKLIEELGYHLS